MNAAALLTDKTIARGLTLERLKAGEAKEVLRLLSRLERNLIADLQRSGLTSWRKARYEKLLEQARQTIKTAYREIRDEQAAKMTEVADLESTWAVRSLNQVISQPVGVYMDVASVSWSAAQLKAIASNALIEQAPSSSWWAKQAAQTRKEFASTVKQGLLRGTPTQEIARTIRNEIYPTSRRNAEALVRTSIAAVSAKARFETMKSQKDLIKGWRQLSTLDSRTTLICQAASNKTWTLDGIPLGHSIPFTPFPRHWGERSQMLPLLKSWSELAGRPVPDGREETIDRLFREKLRAQGFDEDRIASARRRVQSSVDGSVDVGLDFQSWLRTKPAAFQDEALGKGKAELWRKGVITDLSQLVSMQGHPLTLRQLRQEHGILE